MADIPRSSFSCSLCSGGQSLRKKYSARFLRLGKLLVLVILFSISNYLNVNAQSKADSLIYVAMGIEAGAWQLSANPVFLRSAAVPTFAQVGGRAEMVTGAFRRPQDFKRQREVGFGATGLSRAGNWLFFGKFNYGKQYSDSVRFANVAKPYEGNPFITADAVGGNWRGDALEAQIQALAPKIGNWQTSLKLDYATLQSSRDNDPKPLNRVLNYTIEPSIAYSVSNKHTFSLVGGYSYSDETTETGYFADQNPIIYSIRGYGEFSAGPVVTSQRFIKGYGFSIGADYRYGGKGELLFGVRFAYRSQDVNEGVAKPVFIGGFDETRGEAFLSYNKGNKSQGWMTSAKGWYRDGNGFDPIFGSINPAFYFSGVDGKITYWKKTDKGKLFSLALYPGASYTNFFEGIAKTDWTSVMLHQELGVSMTGHRGKNMTFVGEFKLGYHFNIERDIVINRPTILSPILVMPYYQFSAADYLRGALQLLATYQATNVAYQFRGSFDMRRAEGLGTRNITGISLNLIF